MKESVDPKRHNANVQTIRRTCKNELLIVLEKDCDPTSLNEVITCAVGDRVTINTCNPKTLVEIRNIGETVSLDEVNEGVARITGDCPPEGVPLYATASRIKNRGHQAQGICDGAGAVLLASEEAVKSLGLKPLARLVAYSIVGVEPSIMGIGPAPAIQNLLKTAGKSLADIDLVEINEAFGAQTLACAKELKLDLGKLNVNGGAIALGHPLGASGSRITAHLVHELRRRNAKLGVGSACIGGGQGIALLLENVQ